MKPGTRVTFPCQIEAGGFITCMQGGRERTLYDSTSNPLRVEHFKPDEMTSVESEGRTLWVDPTGSYMEMWDPEMCVDGDIYVFGAGERRVFSENEYGQQRTVASFRRNYPDIIAVLRRVPQNT